MTGDEIQETRGLELAAMIDYQKDSVVSKTLMGKAAGTITLFAFDVGQGLSEHSAPFDAFVYAVDGEAEITIGGEKHRLIEGRTITMPADVPHAVRAVTPFKMLLVMIK